MCFLILAYFFYGSVRIIVEIPNKYLVIDGVGGLGHMGDERLDSCHDYYMEICNISFA